MLRQRFYQKWNNDKIIYVKQVSTLKKQIHTLAKYKQVYYFFALIFKNS